MELIQTLGAMAALVFPIIIFVALVMMWRDIRRVADAIAPQDEYYDDDEYDDDEYEEEEFEDEDEEEAPAPKSKSKGKKSAKAAGQEEYAPRKHMEDGVLDLERD